MSNYEILIIDSSKESSYFLEEDLTAEGYRVLALQSGMDGLNYVRSNSVDLVLVDRNLEDVDSIRLCHKLNEINETQSFAIVLISALEDSDDVIAALDTGVADYVRKPYHYPVLSARIRNLFRIKEYQGQLTKARDEALSAKHSKSMLLANMSHEIRTPLNGILGLSALLNETQLNDKQSQYISTINTSAQLLMELINNLLDHSKFEHRQIELDTVPFNFNELLDGALKIVQPTIQDKPIVLSTECSPDLSKSYSGDPGRLRQVFLNLLSNAIKFTREGGVTISIEKLASDEINDELRISVQDSGIGMSPEEMDNLFKPYSQANASISHKFGGTGLGLLISKEIIELHGGEISVSSDKDIGTRFWFTLTLPRSSKEELDKSLNQRELVQIKTTDIKGLFEDKSILIAEDNATNQLLISSLLKPTGAKTSIAENGKECLEMLLEDSYDIILMDAQMPEMDGFETTRMIRSVSRYQSVSTIPIVAMTANALVGDEEYCIAQGMNSYVSKPIEPLVMYQVIHQWLNYSPSE